MIDQTRCDLDVIIESLDQATTLVESATAALRDAFGTLQGLEDDAKTLNQAAILIRSVLPKD